MTVLSEKDQQRLKAFLAAPAADYDPDGVLMQDPYNKALAWAKDPEYGGLPPENARAFANWLEDAWSEYAADQDLTTGEVLRLALEKWIGGRPV